jgi:hypothetical protein
MFKKNILLASIFLSVMAHAQIEISSKTKPELDNSTDGLYVNFSDKGVLIPRVSLKSLTELKTTNENFLIQDDKSQMIVYNTNKALTEGFVFWDGTKWRPLLDFENIIGQLNTSKMYYKVASNGLDFTNSDPHPSTQNLPPYNYLQNTTTSALPKNIVFTAIPNISQKITLTKPTNSVSFTFTGIGQIASEKSLYSFGIGLFVDGKLEYVEPYIYTFGASSCGYISVDFDGIIKGLELNKEHTIDVRIHLRRAWSVNNTDILYPTSFGKLMTGCSNLDEKAMIPKLVLTVKE